MYNCFYRGVECPPEGYYLLLVKQEPDFQTCSTLPYTISIEDSCGDKTFWGSVHARLANMLIYSIASGENRKSGGIRGPDIFEGLATYQQESAAQSKKLLL